MKRVLGLAVCLLLTSANAWAQLETGSVMGSVRDKSGGALADAR